MSWGKKIKFKTRRQIVKNKQEQRGQKDKEELRPLWKLAMESVSWDAHLHGFYLG